MKLKSTLASTLAFGLTAALAATLPTTHAAGPIAPAPAPAAAESAPIAGNMKFAVVDIVKVSDQVDEKVAQTDKLRKLIAHFKQREQTMQADLKKMAEPLNPDSAVALKPGSPEFKAQQDKVLHATINLREYSAYAQQKIDLEHMLRVEQLYHDIDSAIITYASSHGISLVLQKEPLNLNVPNDQALVQEIRSRKVLYSAPSLDITPAVIRTMNQQWEQTHGH
ncbi:MAG: OmpH family outer membrane protein [Phycisphaerales bacterium]|nr:OmpH family outer membrane protein [Phycisphaerales bacterium]